MAEAFGPALERLLVKLSGPMGSNAEFVGHKGNLISSTKFANADPSGEGREGW